MLIEICLVLGKREWKQGTLKLAIIFIIIGGIHRLRGKNSISLVLEDKKEHHRLYIVRRVAKRNIMRVAEIWTSFLEFNDDYSTQQLS